MINRSLILILLLTTALPSWAGTGTYTAGSPDEIALNVMFMYDEQNPEDWEELKSTLRRKLTKRRKAQ